MIRTLPAILAISGLLLIPAAATKAAPPKPSSPVPAAAGLAGNPVRGGQLYSQRCGSCHSLDANRTGPAHRGLIGRKAGSAAGYRYSPALAAQSFVWDARRLDSWLQGPGKMVPGTRMFLSVQVAQDRADLIAYLSRPPS